MFKLDDTQKEAVRSAFNHPITVITGSAGSGKSTICKCIVDIAKKCSMTTRLMTPTGKAAQVLSEKTNSPAMTIHRSLKIKPGDYFPGDKIYEDIIIIDEISMCGIDTIYAIMAALEGNINTRLVLVGDKNQLPSVSPGNFLNDIISSGCANVVTLEKIYRQDEKSYISIVANEIAKGKVTMIPEDASDIKWSNLNSETFESDILKFIDNYLSSGKNIEDLQIISPMKKGTFGVFNINRIMQNKMSEVNNTKSNYIQMGFNKFYLGDRVIQMENNYEKNVFNGDMGIIIELGEKVLNPSVSDKISKFITVKFLWETVTYVGQDIDQLSLSWAITVHKFQGSQSKYVVMIVANEAQIMMSKELIYTAMTRASKFLNILGHQNMLRIAPTRSVIKRRYTNMQKIIKEKMYNVNILKVLEKENKK